MPISVPDQTTKEEMLEKLIKTYKDEEIKEELRKQKENEEKDFKPASEAKKKEAWKAEEQGRSINTGRGGRKKKLEKLIKKMNKKGTNPRSWEIIKRVSTEWDMREKTVKEYVQELISQGKIKEKNGRLSHAQVDTND